MSASADNDVIDMGVGGRRGINICKVAWKLMEESSSRRQGFSTLGSRKLARQLYVRVNVAVLEKRDRTRGEKKVCMKKIMIKVIN